MVNFSYYKELRNDDAHLWLILTNLHSYTKYRAFTIIILLHDPYIRKRGT